MKHRSITFNSIEEAILDDDLIEHYPDDYPVKSVLLGYDNKGIPLHVVCSPHSNGLVIITSYVPSPKEWEEDW